MTSTSASTSPDSGSVPGQTLPAHAHLTNIGGAGMSAIAALLLSRGTSVSGSDANDTEAMEVLRAAGARTTIGYAAEDVAALPAGAVLVVSSATKDDNPQLVRARELGLPVLHRSQMLEQLMAGSRQIAVAGTHGKSTTTSMAAVALTACGLDPSYAIGADLAGPGTNAHAGSGDLFVVEADESDESFLRTAPTVGIVTSVEADHLDHYGTLEAIETAFLSYARGIVPGGHLVVCADHPGAMRLAEAARAEGVAVVTYGTAEDADLGVRALELTPQGAAFTAVLRGEELGRVQLQVPGLHNALDAAAALAAGMLVGAPARALIAGLESFTGARRRFERKGTAHGVLVVDDYAHNPAKVAATVAAARSVVGDGRLIAVFQPHLYSRTRDFAAEFAESLSGADWVLVLPVYGAREQPMDGITSALITDAPALHDHRETSRLQLVARDEVVGIIGALAYEGDLVLVMGAGDVTELTGPMLASLEES